MTAALAVSAIGFYQQFLSPYKGFRCAHRVRHGRMSCSQFAKRLIQKVGLLRFAPAVPPAAGEMRAGGTDDEGGPASSLRRRTSNTSASRSNRANAIPPGTAATGLRRRLHPGRRRVRPARREPPRGTRRLRLRRVRPVHLTPPRCRAAAEGEWRRRRTPTVRSGIVRAVELLGRLQPAVLVVAMIVAQATAAPAARGEAVTTAGSIPADQLEFFETRIRPLLVEHCYGCHSAAQARSSRAGCGSTRATGIRKGGDSGRPAVVPGDADAQPARSRRCAGRTPTSRCRRSRSCREQQIADLVAWVNIGRPTRAKRQATAKAPLARRRRERLLVVPAAEEPSRSRTCRTRAGRERRSTGSSSRSSRRRTSSPRPRRTGGR